MNEKELREQKWMLGVAEREREKGNEEYACEIEGRVVLECANHWFLDVLSGKRMLIVQNGREIKVDL